MKFAHERRIQFAALAAGLPAVAASMWILWTGDYSSKVQWTLTAVIILTWLGFANSVREMVASPLRTVANLLEAIREGDYSIRGRTSLTRGSLGEVIEQVNQMGTTLQQQRLGALEASALLRKVMEEINVAIFAFDADYRLRLVNRGGVALLGRPMERLLGETAVTLGLEDCLRGSMRTLTRGFPGCSGRWGVSCGTFREGGVPHQLLVLTDLTRPLREEELQAWQRLVRVLGHELNNSLAPIKSIAGSLGNILDRDPLPDDWKEDMRHGLKIVGSRAESLQRFLSAYTRLAKLPSPTLARTSIEPLIRRAAAMELRKKVEIEMGPQITIDADCDQLEQLLINLIKNAVEAAQTTSGAVRVGWGLTTVLAGPRLEIWVHDEGPGLANTNNLFVPFFTTKPGGSGIGLVLSRQIAEAHGGILELENNSDGPGCTAKLLLPLGTHDPLAPSSGFAV